MRTLALSVILSILLAGPGASAAVQDDGIDPLRETFSLLHQSLMATGGVHEPDHEAIETLRDRVKKYRKRHADDSESLAMELQLSIWLRDNDTVNTLFAKLVKLESDRPSLRTAWIGYFSGVDDGARVESIYEGLVSQFPDDAGVRQSWADSLRRRNAFAEAIDVIKRRGFDVGQHPRLAMLLADCLFAEEQYQESLDILEAITEEQRASEPTVAIQLDLALTTRREYVEFWAKEQELRSQEEARGDLPQATIRTVKGDIVVELFEDQAPNTVANFVSLADAGFYDGQEFHRVINTFMAQTGDPRTRQDSEATTDGPGYRIADEHIDENARQHFTGSLAMANTGSPDSGGSQFYLTVQPTFHLNGKHTVFGRVIEGLELVRALEADDALEAIVITNKRDHPYEPQTLPVIPSIPAPTPLTIGDTITPILVDDPP